MTDKLESRIYTPLKWLLYLFSFFYGLGIYTRSLLYKFNFFKVNKVPLKVVSVGNLTLGGTGKTPFVITLANIVKDDIKKEVSVLIRGYGWDEQAMLKKNLPVIPILVGEDRVRSSRRAIKLYGSEVAILDDGFQHWELVRDLDIVLIDSRNPFGNGYLFPRGILREPKNAIKRADIIVFTKVNKTKFNIDMIKSELNKMSNGLIFLEAMHRPVSFYDVKARNTLGLDHVNNRKVILLSSIGDPEYFEETVKDLGAKVAAHIIFSDHHNYNEKDIGNIAKRCGEKNFDLLITTEKDAVKLTRLGLAIANYPLLTLSVEMDIVSGKEALLDRLHSLCDS